MMDCWKQFRIKYFQILRGGFVMNVIKNISANNLNVSHFCVNLVALSLMLLYAIFVLPVLREGIEKI